MLRGYEYDSAVPVPCTYPPITPPPLVATVYSVLVWTVTVTAEKPLPGITDQLPVNGKLFKVTSPVIVVFVYTVK